jgi:L-asparaginase II
LQKEIRAAIEDTAGEKVSYVAVDGCGAPIFALTLSGLARSFGLFAGAAPDTGEGRIADAFRAHPEYASGSTRDEAELMRATEGLFCKAGAEGVYAVGLADGTGIALKLEDGTPRARKVVMAATLQRLGITNETIENHLHFDLTGGDRVVGAVRPHAPTFG